MPRMRPEVKYKTYLTTGNFRTLVSSSSDLSNSDYFLFGAYPSQGTTDGTRIGDTINPIKYWIRITFHNSIFSPVITSYQIRIIIFSMPVVVTTTGPITNFWQTTTQLPVTQGVVDREVVHKVYYDKKFVINQNFTDHVVMRKPLSIKIRLKNPIVFNAGGTTPKQPRDVLYYSIFAYDTVSTTNSATGKFQFASSFYYTDA